MTWLMEILKIYQQSWTKHLRQTLVFKRNSALRDSNFQEFFASIDKTLILGGRLGARL